MGAPPVIIYSKSEHGHRRSLIELMSRELGAERRPLSALWLAKAPVLFLMIEENFLLFCGVACARAMLSRRTVGFCLRPKPALKARSLRAWLKQMALRTLRRFRVATVVTFLPFYADQRMGAIAAAWIFDPQLWDLHAEDRAYFATARKARGTSEKPCVVAAGLQSREKGFDRFAALAQSAALASRYAFHSVGRVERSLKDAANALQANGGRIVNREVSDRELLEAYAEADLIWGCYAPDYDQASGIVSRAAQLGIPTVLRPGSLMQAVCAHEGLPHLLVEDLQAGASVPSKFDGATFADRFRATSLTTLRRVLGLRPEVLKT